MVILSRKNNLLDEAMEILNELHKWDESVRIAEKYNHPEIQGIKSQYFSWLVKNDQLDRAAELKEKEGDFNTAISLYIKGGYPAKAANLVKNYEVFTNKELSLMLNKTLLKKKHTSIKTFIKIENNLNTFIKVKFLVSFLTGIGTGLGCFYFDISFPIFWGLFSFIINFIQMVGSFITVILLSIFAFVELDPTSTLVFFILTISSVQVLFGAILEPIFMGKSFSFFAFYAHYFASCI